MSSRSISDSNRPKVGDVIDINNGILHRMLQGMFTESVLLKSKDEQRLFPSALLFDDEGLRIWSQIIDTPTYQQTSDEIKLLEQHGKDIATYVIPGSNLLDIGAGDVRKVRPLLDAIEQAQIHVQYFAIDLSHESLRRAMDFLVPRYNYVKCFGLWGTFIDALRWTERICGPLCFLSLGSFLGNDKFDSAVARLTVFRSIMRSDDLMLLGMDARPNAHELWQAYHDPGKLFEKFLRNGLENSNNILGCRWYFEEDWAIEGLIEEAPLRHRFLIKAIQPVVCEELRMSFDVGEAIDCFEVFKYDPTVMLRQFDAAGLKEKALWKSPNHPNCFYEYLLAPAT